MQSVLGYNVSLLFSTFFDEDILAPIICTLVTTGVHEGVSMYACMLWLIILCVANKYEPHVP